MKKIPTIFERDWQGDRSRVIDIQNPECAWVFSGEGKATRKLDGTCCRMRGGVLYKRREISGLEIEKSGMPIGFELEGTDLTTDKAIGWVPVGDGNEDRWHREAFEADLPDGTYELVGPKIQGNPERLPNHYLFPHAGVVAYDGAPRDFDGLRAWLDGKDIEGLVFHHPDGRMAKIKLRDFGLKRVAKP